MNILAKLRSQKGNTTIAFLILLPLIFITLLVMLDHSKAVFSSDLDLQQALDDACRSSALTADPYSQAINKPMVVPDTAHQVFRHVLANNLSLDNNLQPLAGAGIDAVEYEFIVFNGTNTVGLPEGMVYTTADPVGTAFSGTLPQKFTVTSSAIEIGEGTGTITELDEPGCLAIVTAKLKPILGSQETDEARWSSAKMVK